MLLSSKFLSESISQSRKAVRRTLYGDEAVLIKQLLKYLSISPSSQTKAFKQAETWIKTIQASPSKAFDLQAILKAYPLSTHQGRSLMCLAEALLRIPDRLTAKQLIQDKMHDVDWSVLRDSWGQNQMVKVASTGLQLANAMIDEKSWTRFLKIASDPLLVKSFRVMMQRMGREFILGRTIEDALNRSKKSPQNRFSYDMLGEAARTWPMAAHYKTSYKEAIEKIHTLKVQADLEMPQRDSISVKLSALHPHYFFSKYDEVMDRLFPDLLELCEQAMEAGIALTVDAEEVERLDVSLAIFEKITASPSLRGWGGFGYAVQAYQKRGMAVIEWADKLSQTHDMPLMVRLVKGAYWDTEIKLAQTEGLPDYPVFTRKPATDISYLACAKRLLEAKGHLYPQFATHNLHTIASIRQLAGKRNDFEFQRLHGMGEDIYQAVNSKEHTPVRVYAPVGNYQDLLAYLVRRLLENGANSSFIHKIYDKSHTPKETIADPFEFFKEHAPGPHPKIPAPRDIFKPQRTNSSGDDLADPLALESMNAEIETANYPAYIECGQGETKTSLNPAHLDEVIGEVKEAQPDDLEAMLDAAQKAQPTWDQLGGDRRADILDKAATLLEGKRGQLLKLLIKEGGKVLADAQDEIREAVDFCRYYAQQARIHYGTPLTLPGPTGELNQLNMRGRGTFACISPWNFPLAIFAGQVTAALAAGNAVIAKPASQTPFIAKSMLDVLVEAGVPQEVLHLAIGPGRTVGSALINDPRISGIAFTGSTETSQYMRRVLAERGGPIIPFIAETGGLNTMVVDSSALIEQVVDDVISSAFQSAGQRCSALRVLLVQEDIYDPLMDMLSQATEELTVGDPQWLATDIGPIIDTAARDEIESYVEGLKTRIRVRTPLPENCAQGAYVAPTILEMQSITEVTSEVFGPVLHVCRYKAKDFETTLQSVNDMGYGLTFGLQSRIGTTFDKVRKTMKVGNIYINRNTIGAVVGVQPFGGEGLSGTGPKAGGPHYLPHFGVERTWTDNIMASGGNVELLNLGE
jgi:RHH-type proline utilization regulon transcriptional repressor/proline dehydrogenase/delta 1-pyrroline-5-carboxylate dehydrogenase